VIFRTNDNTGVIYASRTIASGSALGGSFPGNPAGDGYTFAGWNTAPLGGGTAFTSATTVSADTTVYAQWTGLSYTVTFMSNYPPDTALHTKTVAFPAVLITGFPANPVRASYNFAGWNTRTDGLGTAFGLVSEVHGNMTVYAQWVHEQFNITLNPDAGDGAFSQSTFTISKGGGTGSQTVNITGQGYTNPRWEVDGELKGTGNSITINAADYSVGGHILTLIISKGGVSWSKEIGFTVN
jgi:uncharacterized repeat protein (TIGR02543 family)